MDTQELILKSLDILTWPIIILVIVCIMKTPLQKLLPLLSSLKYKDFELNFKRQLEELKDDMPVDENVPAETGENNSKLFKLAETSPRSAVLEAWRKLELAVEKKSKIYYQTSIMEHVPLGQPLALLNLQEL